MARSNYAFANFTAGELSPRLAGRTDLAKYFNGCETLENFLIHPHGGATRRPGTRFIAEVKTSSAKTRLIPFQFNITQAYILEFGNEYFRIYKDGGQITSGSPAAAVEVSTEYTTAQIPDLKFAQSADVMYVVHPEHPVRKIARTSHTAWTITDVVLKRGPFLDANTTTTTLTSGGLTGSVTITASAVTGINSDTGFQTTDIGRLIKLHHGYAKITARASTTQVTATVQENDYFVSELAPAYAASTISFKEGDPSSTGLEHNDRIIDSDKNFIVQGFQKGMKIAITGSTSNNKTVLAVAVTEDTILVAPSDDLTDEAADSGHTLTGTLAADKDFALGAFSDTTGHPSSVCFYEQRLTFAGTTDQPQTLFFSVSGDFENFTGGVNDDSGLVYTLGSNQVNIIRYLSSSRVLLVGTSGGEFAVRAGGADEPITATNVQIKQQSAFGSANKQPVQVGNTTLFLHRAERKVRELVFNFDTDSYIAPDLTILAEHVTENGLSEMTYQQEPDSVVWVVRSDGVLLGMTYRREEQVVAWHRHIIGGVSGAATITVTDYANIAAGTELTLTKSDGTTVTFTSEAEGSGDPSDTSLGWRPYTNNNTTADNIYTRINAHADFTVANPAANVVTIEETQRAGAGFLTIASQDETRLAVTSQSHALVESVASIPGTGEDELYMIVQRTINGSTKRYVEYMKSFDFGTDIEDAFFLDSGLTYTGSAATSLSGLTHLEGEPVRVITNGSTHTDAVVSSAAISLTRSTTKAHVGLRYDSTLETMRLEAGSTDGTAQNKLKRIDEVTLRLFRTVNALVGGSTANLDRIPFRSGADLMDKAVPLFSGDKEIEMPTGYDADTTVVVRQDLPLPMTVVAIYARAQTFD